MDIKIPPFGSSMPPQGGIYALLCGAMRGLFHMTNKMPPARYAEDIFYMPVVGVEQTYFSIWAIPQYADPDGMWFFTTDFAIPNFEFAPPQEKCGLKVWSMAKENEPLRAVALLFSLLLTEP